MGKRKAALVPAALELAETILAAYVRRLDGGVNLTATKGGQFHSDLTLVLAIVREAQVEPEEEGA